jgi:hypothetical protein
MVRGRSSVLLQGFWAHLPLPALSGAGLDWESNGFTSGASGALIAIDPCKSPGIRATLTGRAADGCWPYPAAELTRRTTRVWRTANGVGWTTPGDATVGGAAASWRATGTRTVERATGAIDARLSKIAADTPAANERRAALAGAIRAAGICESAVRAWYATMPAMAVVDVVTSPIRPAAPVGTGLGVACGLTGVISSAGRAWRATGGATHHVWRYANAGTALADLVRPTGDTGRTVRTTGCLTRSR